MLSSKLSLVTFATAVMTSSTSAAHLKVHMHQNEPHDNQLHHKAFETFDPKDFVDDGGLDYLTANYAEIYAVCSFRHNGFLWVRDEYSNAFFDQDGNVLVRFCTQNAGIPFSAVTDLAKNPDDWTSVEIDEQSMCHVFKDVKQDAEWLIQNYRCK